jgi:hypothetical protein
MQIKANAKLGDVVLSNLQLENVNLTEFTPLQKQCVQCLQEIKTGEKVLVIFSAEMGLVLNEIPLKEPYLVHAEPQNGKYCTEDFIARLMLPVETPVEKAE